MPRKSKRRAMLEALKKEVRQKVLNNDFVDATGIFDPIPPRERVREELAKPPICILDRTFRVIKVEDLGDYKVFIQIPGEKTKYDFFVWRAVYNGGTLVDLNVPSHDDLGKMYLGLKTAHNMLEEHLINATLRFIRDRWPLSRVLEVYFRGLPAQLANEVKKFLLTLKWIAIEEDANYPPPNLGSLYALSVYAVLEVTGDLQALRKIIKF